MATTSIWTLTHVTFDTETKEWRLKGERIGPPIDENPHFQVIEMSFSKAIEAWEKEAQRRDKGPKGFIDAR